MDGLSITDLIWNSSVFVSDIETNKEFINFNNEENEFSDKTPRPSKALVDIKQFKQLLETKEKIPHCIHWDKWSKLTNPYDRVQHLAKNKNTKDYYKFFEIFKYYNIARDSPENGSSAHMGESSLNSAKALTHFMPKISWYSNVEKILTNGVNNSQSNLNKILKSDSENVRDENGFSRLIYSDINLSIIDNLKFFRETIGKVDIITGDCTTDTKHDPINQEQLGFYLLFSQIITALHMQSINGHFVIKIFDTITRPSCQLIYYLTNFYDTVSIIKPRCSRYTNSEKFMVAKKFKGITNEELKKLDKLLNNWEPDKYLRTMGISIPEEIEKQFFNYNGVLINNQFNYIEKTIKCNYSDDDIPEKQLEAFQNKNALLFCTNFGIPINLSDSDVYICKHLNKKKIQIGMLKNSMICEKCFSFLLVK